MKLTVKSIKQQAYEVDVAPESTVKQLKQEVEAKHGFDHTTLKLLYKGTLLDDAKFLKDYNINEGEVLVMMNMKAKPVNVPKEEEKKEETSSSQTKTETKPTGTTTTTTTQQNKPKQEKDYTAQLKQLA